MTILDNGNILVDIERVEIFKTYCRFTGRITGSHGGGSFPEPVAISTVVIYVSDAPCVSRYVFRGDPRIVTLWLDSDAFEGMRKEPWTNSDKNHVLGVASSLEAGAHFVCTYGIAGDGPVIKFDSNGGQGSLAG